MLAKDIKQVSSTFYFSWCGWHNIAWLHDTFFVPAAQHILVYKRVRLGIQFIVKATSFRVSPSVSNSKSCPASFSAEYTHHWHLIQLILCWLPSGPASISVRPCHNELSKPHLNMHHYGQLSIYCTPCLLSLYSLLPGPLAPKVDTMWHVGAREGHSATHDNLSFVLHSMPSTHNTQYLDPIHRCDQLIQDWDCIILSILL